jgi:hypothetical protein
MSGSRMFIREVLHGRDGIAILWMTIGVIGITQK